MLSKTHEQLPRIEHRYHCLYINAALYSKRHGACARTRRQAALSARTSGRPGFEPCGESGMAGIPGAPAAIWEAHCPTWS